MPEVAEIAVPVPASRPAALRSRLAVILGAHTLVDMYAAFVAPLLGLLEVRCGLTATQTVLLLGSVSVSSGVSQPIAAWLNDRLDSRAPGALGLVGAAVCLSCLGLADDFWTLLGLCILGQIGVGMFHPVGASSMGHLSERLSGSRRSLGISVFFVAGMAGGVIGARFAPTVAGRPGGFELLRYAMIPGLLAAIVLHTAIRRMPHRHDEHRDRVKPIADVGRRWRMVGVLYVANAMRFTVNMALFYLFVRWAQRPFASAHPGWDARQVAEAAASINGNLVALVILGMAIGGMVAGATVRPGREKRPMIVVPILFAPVIALFPVAGVGAGYALALLSGIGFAAVIPVTLALGQRLLPHRTSLASGLVLGGAWSLAIAGPLGAEMLLQMPAVGLDGAFVVTAILLAASGLICVVLDGDLLSAHGDGS